MPLISPFFLACGTIALAVINVWLAGGVIYGLPSIYSIFYHRGSWSQSCGSEEAWSCANNATGTKCCDAQLDQITMLSSICYFIADASAALWGEAVDRAGVPPVLGIAAFLSCTGALGIGLGVHYRSELVTSSSLISLAFGGPGIFFASYKGCLMLLSAPRTVLLTKKQQSALAALLPAFIAAAFDGSALMLRLVRALSNHATRCPRSVATVWMVTIVIVSFLFFVSLYSWLNAEVKTADGSAVSAQREELGQSKAVAKEDSHLLSSSASPASLSRTIFGKLNLLLLCFMTTLNLSCTFYMQTIEDQAHVLFGEDRGDVVSNTFQLAFPIVGLASAVIAFLVIGNCEAQFVRWTIVASIGLLHALLFIIPLYGSQIGAAVVFGLLRTMQWSIYFDILSNEKFVHRSYYSRVFGYNSLIIAGISDFLPYALTDFIIRSPTDQHATLYFANKLGIALAFATAATVYCWRVRAFETRSSITDSSAWAWSRSSFLGGKPEKGISDVTISTPANQGCLGWLSLCASPSATLTDKA
eukprot:CAMPEP_0184381712 /NCGR_PEP_ID=MMETSP0007-20130409/5736_1 /TAXON_ID=97485 /ORGANISM="Prymnesium parvum, Strain Texoma1" /LENGTH=529 /DNA_ID=CAMNT_0026727433 /DNA_START=23 /DNA_END=1612 /DNA_ORIENTATION=+